MGYTSSNLHLSIASFSGLQDWDYGTTDGWGSVCAANYFSDAYDRGMKPGDTVNVAIYAGYVGMELSGLLTLYIGVVRTVTRLGATIAPIGNLPMTGQFTLATNAQTTTVAVAGLWPDSAFVYSPAPGANSFYAASMYPDLQPISQALGSITFNHPSAANVLAFSYMAGPGVVPGANQFTLQTGVTSTVISIPGLLASSTVLYAPAAGVNSAYAASMYPDLQPASQSANTLVLNHPITNNVCTFSYLVSL